MKSLVQLKRKSNLTLRLLAFLLILSTLSCGYLSVMSQEEVWAEWVFPLWYHGKIEARCEKGFRIRFDHQDEKCNSIAEVVSDVSPRREEIEVGKAVLIPSEEEGQRIQVRVAEIVGQSYRVRFADGREQEFDLESLRVIQH